MPSDPPPDDDPLSVDDIPLDPGVGGPPGDREASADRPSIRPPENVAVVGIVGGVASGKSTLAKWLERTQGWPRIDADLIGHSVLTRDDVRDALRRRFGDAIFRPDGSVERPALAHLVFGVAEDRLKNRRDLEAIVHPVIADVIVAEVHAAARFEPTPGGIIVDAPVLLEAGLGPLCDRVIFLDTKESVRKGRAVRGRGWSEDEWRSREQSQWPLAKKRDYADVVVEAGLSVDETGKRAVELLTAPQAAG
ncbi:MAG: dephospho-CoA kinase [Planctomycetota bacterium]